MPRKHRKSTIDEKPLPVNTQQTHSKLGHPTPGSLTSSVAHLPSKQSKPAISSGSSKYPWTPWSRFAISILLIYHIMAMFVSPWAVPPTSRFAAGLESYFAKYQTVLYLNHGYRFFAPDPGPASVVSYEMIMPDGSQLAGIFPDTDAINRQYPRLLYHRWFMLSETMGRLFGNAITPQQFQQFVQEEEAEIIRLRKQNQREQADQAAAVLAAEKKTWAELMVQRQMLLKPLAKSLSLQHNASEIRLSLNRRLIPSLTEARLGMKTSDQRLMEPANAIELGTWKIDSDSGDLVETSSTKFGDTQIEAMPSRLGN